MRKVPLYKTAIDVAFILVLVVVSWWLATDVFDVLPSRIFPSPGKVFAQIIEDAEKIGTGIASSLGIVAEGFLLGGLSALVLGLFLGSQALVITMLAAPSSLSSETRRAASSAVISALPGSLPHKYCASVRFGTITSAVAHMSLLWATSSSVMPL